MKLASNRSLRWAFMQRFEVPNYDDDSLYLIRIRLIQTPWFGIYLHRFDGPDPRATLHDHPWAFLSIILRGGYIERRLDTMTMQVNETRRVRWFNVMPKTGAHAIMSLLRVPSWTLMFVGRRKRVWGYWEPEGNSWRWTQFDLHSYNDEFIKALARRSV